jgi:Kef-type K+ transport system membrane component KefB
MRKSTLSVRLILCLVVLALVWSAPARAGAEPGAGQPTADTEAVEFERILYALVIILLAAKVGGDLLERVGQPAVLGELVFGVLLGNAFLIGIPWFEPLKGHQAVTVLAEIGVILLLFEVGLESTVSDMMKVGLSSFLVALLGVIAPFFLGWGVAAWFLPGHSIYVHIFIGATLTATSVGITARVLKDLGRIKAKESRIILGAAVIDDIMGLVILAVVSGIISSVDRSGAGVSSLAILWIIAKAVIFLFGAIVVGGYLSPRLFRVASRLRVAGMLLTTALAVCFVLAWLAAVMGLAPIVGAFAAGLILEKVHFREFHSRGEHELEELIHPLAVFLVPIFFVEMGMAVDLRTFADGDVLLFALVLTLAAIIGKQAAAFGVIGKGLNRLAVGLGMIPRGEVGLIFAAIGARMMVQGEPVIAASVYSAVVIMVIVTTLVTPPVLKIALERGDPKP